MLVNGGERERERGWRRGDGEGGRGGEREWGGRKERNGNALFDPPSLALGELPPFAGSARLLPPPPMETVRSGCRLCQVWRALPAAGPVDSKDDFLPPDADQLAGRERRMATG